MGLAHIIIFLIIYIRYWLTPKIQLSRIVQIHMILVVIVYNEKKNDMVQIVEIKFDAHSTWVVIVVCEDLARWSWKGKKRGKYF